MKFLEWLTRIIAGLIGFGETEAISGGLDGLVLRPIELTGEEPHDTLAQTLTDELEAHGAEFDDSAILEVAFEFKTLGTSSGHMHVWVQAEIGNFPVSVEVREGFPYLTEVDFNIHQTIKWTLGMKTTLFYRRAGEKLVAAFIPKYRFAGKSRASP